jgi:hypothetical protein
MKEYKIITGLSMDTVAQEMNNHARDRFIYESLNTTMTPNGMLTTVIMSREVSQPINLTSWLKKEVGTN